LSNNTYTTDQNKNERINRQIFFVYNFLIDNFRSGSRKKIPLTIKNSGTLTLEKPFTAFKNCHSKEWISYRWKSFEATWINTTIPIAKILKISAYHTLCFILASVSYQTSFSILSNSFYIAFEKRLLSRSNAFKCLPL